MGCISVNVSAELLIVCKLLTVEAKVMGWVKSLKNPERKKKKKTKKTKKKKTKTKTKPEKGGVIFFHLPSAEIA